MAEVKLEYPSELVFHRPHYLSLIVIISSSDRMVDELAYDRKTTKWKRKLTKKN